MPVSSTRGDDYKTGIRLWQAQQLHTSLKPSARTATRRMYTSRCQQRAAPTDPYKHILEQDSPDGMQTTIRALHSCGVQQTGPILAACCGHLLDDLDTEDDTDICEHCSMPFTTNNCASRQTQQMGSACGTGWQAAQMISSKVAWPYTKQTYSLQQQTANSISKTCMTRLRSYNQPHQTLRPPKTRCSV